ncbi:wax ester/triacylglycerol synthase family O-acyltransferase [Mycobacterium sp. ACS4331]|uniref:WS/DGAT/MGAT family O-acyltransferase n=1 Tax=Mycobacterium sp. ACS4331 TaxID=1834121 RepID=UPI0008001950|nr:wax ester/triacylglycerol synthase family O-acyltransferase [Mycobacterium sp. ACS4331]OBF25518.1 diacylglycerol O-acyltransferase [Mycobacterium sp. ACS4331]
MEQLSPLDAGFLEAEDSDPHVSLAVGGVSVLAGPAPEFAELLAEIADRAHGISRFTQRVRMHPLDLEPPEWVPDPCFDIAHHVHRAALPAPGDDAEFFALVARLMEGRLDRERPLWRCWIIEGLTDGRWAVLVKIHHCIADGIATSQLLGRLFDDDGGPRSTFVSEIRAAKTPDPPAPTFPRPSLNPLKWAGELWQVTTSAADAVERAVVGAAELTVGVLSGAPDTSLRGSVSRMRRFSAARVALADLDQVCTGFGVTLNDVALAAITASYRSMLLDRGEVPSAAALRTLVPVSVRAMGDLGVADNRVAVMLPLLPVDEPDPVTRLTIVHERLTRVKGSGQREGVSALVKAAQNIPFALTAWAVRLLIRFPQRSVTALATNVPGPRTRQRLMGREVLEMIPIPPLALQLRTGIAMLSYADQFFFGVLADYDSAPDVDVLAEGIEAEVANLAGLSRQRTKRREPSGRPPASAS